MLSKLLRKYLGIADLLVSLGGKNKNTQPCVCWRDASDWGKLAAPAWLGSRVLLGLSCPARF